MKTTTTQLSLIAAILVLAVIACKKDINPDRQLPNGTILHMDGIDLPGVINPFKVVASYYKADAGYYKYYVVSNNGVYINSSPQGLKPTKNAYTWTNGRMFVPIVILNNAHPDKNYYKYLRTDSLGNATRDTLTADQLPK